MRRCNPLTLTLSLIVATIPFTHLCAQTVVRGPYLQVGTPNGVTIRWRTDAPTASIVHYGSSPTTLTQRSGSETPTTEHEVALSELSPKSRYFYSVEGTKNTATAYPFTTYPADEKTALRAWVLGDPGISGKLPKGEDPGQAAVRDSFLKAVPVESLNLILLLGDNTYYKGTDVEYQRGVFDFYKSTIRSLVMWPTQGNHDNTDKAYYDVFTLPERGEAGGVSSETERYYSFDFSNTHFIVLNSEIDDPPFRAAMLQWLKRDLQENKKTWTVVTWHHPPHTKGTHDSDDTAKEGTHMLWMRENVNPIIEQAGVDLVLTGHSHNYERTALIDGFYGVSSAFGPQHIKQGSLGNPREGKPYTKQRSQSHSGTVYVVAGNSGFVEECPLNHPAMVESHYRLGSLLLEANESTLSVSLYGITGQVEDYFAITK
jgi:phosphodiesterase/alkaline phosphatase D-like protein